ncbi:NAD-dependent epimerase/dehydratase family protein [Luteipulveratus halotolerans]|uniref:Oxidoreductase n=1 Tax=Luteipulveratus halotolerans TaxID=1631356 RepID=A0A0L6CGZ5_9MICO|nr:NAD-dependent epimerase/dehydratase family protein [Luteipulveratus halotolerans]KNX37077.1 oxidoreductase [Luteipulveratus halotolerans]
MRLLVLGGTAWLGSYVVREALGRGHEVVALARGESGVAPTGATFVRGDRSTAEGYADLSGDFDAVVDVTRLPLHMRTALKELRSRVTHWVFVSTCSVYADHDVPGADESAPLLPALEGDDWTAEQYGEGKVACEQLLLEAVGPDRAFIARSGLIAGPDDISDRTGYWPLRFAHPSTEDGGVLVLDAPDLQVQVIDGRDLAGWLVAAAEGRVTGTFNAMGRPLPFADYIATVRETVGHTGPVVLVDQDWLTEHGVQPWAGDRSLPLWLPLPEYAGFSSRSVDAALAQGLTTRPLADTVRDGLEWELRQGPGRRRKAGLTPTEEAELVRQRRADA